MPTLSKDLWSLTCGRPQVDPAELARAIERELLQPLLDSRTRLLIRDALDALGKFWGADRLEKWLNQSKNSGALKDIHESDLGPPGFPSLYQRMIDETKPDTVLQFLRELGVNLPNSQRIEIGGAIALILSGYLSRHTDDIDLVNEVPAEIRSQHDVLQELTSRYGLHLTHFQSHFLPGGWQQRLHSLGMLGQLNVYLVDPADIFVGKLFSQRTKDLDDLRLLSPQLNKSELKRRLFAAADGLLANTTLAQNAARNWYILYGETLLGPPKEFG